MDSTGLTPEQPPKRWPWPKKDAAYLGMTRVDIGTWGTRELRCYRANVPGFVCSWCRKPIAAGQPFACMQDGKPKCGECDTAIKRLDRP